MAHCGEKKVEAIAPSETGVAQVCVTFDGLEIENKIPLCKELTLKETGDVITAIEVYTDGTSTLSGEWPLQAEEFAWSAAWMGLKPCWMWEDSPSLVLASKDSIYGVLFGGIRDAQYQDQPLKILHI